MRTDMVKNRDTIENTPWDILTEERLNESSSYSGLVLKAFRVSKGWNNKSLANMLGITRISTMNRLETLDRIGIKRAKEFAEIFKVSDYRIFRSREDLEKYRPSEEAVKALEEAAKYFNELNAFVVSTTHTVGDKGEEAIKAVVKTKKRAFSEELNGVKLIVEKV